MIKKAIFLTFGAGIILFDVVLVWLGISQFGQPF